MKEGKASYRCLPSLDLSGSVPVGAQVGDQRGSTNFLCWPAYPWYSASSSSVTCCSCGFVKGIMFAFPWRKRPGAGASLSPQLWALSVAAREICVCTDGRNEHVLHCCTGHMLILAWSRLLWASLIDQMRTPRWKSKT